MPPPLRSLLSLVTLLALTSLAACSKKIGDPCVLSADCGVQSSRQCDTSQPGGYCTQIGCSKDGCSKEAACFLFQPRLGGCSYDDREPARTSKSFCMRSCSGDGSCRVGYICADVTKEPWGAILLDTIELKPKACILAATFAGVNDDNPEPSAICDPVGPSFDAGLDEAEPDAGDSDAGDSDGEPDAGDEPDAAP